jgi:hypothetical protein
MEENLMTDREETFLLLAADAARSQAEYDARLDREIDAMIDKILAEEPGREQRVMREAEAYEQALADAADLIKARQAVETGSLPGIRRALRLRTIGVPVALTLAYRLGLEFGRGRAQRSPTRRGDPS